MHNTDDTLRADLLRQASLNAANCSQEMVKVQAMLVQPAGEQHPAHLKRLMFAAKLAQKIIKEKRKADAVLIRLAKSAGLFSDH